LIPYEYEEKDIKYCKKSYHNMLKYIKLDQQANNYDMEDYNCSENILERLDTQLEKLENTIDKFIMWYLNKNNWNYIDSETEQKLIKNKQNMYYYDGFSFYDELGTVNINIEGKLFHLQRDGNSYLLYSHIRFKSNDTPYYSMDDCFKLTKLSSMFECIKLITDKKPGIYIKIQEECV